MTKMVLFGERPGPNTDPYRPLFPHTTTGAAARLISYLGVSREEYLAETVRYNVYRDGDREMSLFEARERVGLLHLRHSEEDPRTPFVFVGKSALRAAPNPAWRDLDFMQSLGKIHLIPHTSGANRFYNEEANRDAVSRFLRDIWRNMRCPE